MSTEGNIHSGLTPESFSGIPFSCARALFCEFETMQWDDYKARKFPTSYPNKLHRILDVSLAPGYETQTTTTAFNTRNGQFDLLMYVMDELTDVVRNLDSTKVAEEFTADYQATDTTDADFVGGKLVLDTILRFVYDYPNLLPVIAHPSRFFLMQGLAVAATGVADEYNGAMQQRGYSFKDGVNFRSPHIIEEVLVSEKRCPGINLAKKFMDKGQAAGDLNRKEGHSRKPNIIGGEARIFNSTLLTDFLISLYDYLSAFPDEETVARTHTFFAEEALKYSFALTNDELKVGLAIITNKRNNPRGIASIEQFALSMIAFLPESGSFS